MKSTNDHISPKKLLALSICVMEAVAVSAVARRIYNLTILSHLQKVVRLSLKIYSCFVKSVIKRKVIGYNL